MLALSGVLGLLAGLGLVFLRNSLKPGIKSADELEQALGLHVFATTPKSALQQQLAVDIITKMHSIHLLAAVKPEEAAMQGASQQYDIVIIDTPPVLAVADTAVLAPQAGTVFLLARSEITSLGEVQESLKRLTQAGVTVKGAIFNGLDLSKRRYGQSYGYGYKRYGYRYQAYQYGPAETK